MVLQKFDPTLLPNINFVSSPMDTLKLDLDPLESDLDTLDSRLKNRQIV